MQRRALAAYLAILAAMPLSTVIAAEGSGKSLNLDAYRGKVVLLDFWASWCVPCRQSFPWLNAMHEKYGARGLVVIGINVDRERADAERFLKDVPARFDIVYDPAGALATQYEVPGMPSSYVFDAGGKLINKHIGFRNASRDEREAELQKLLTSQAR
jgi:cytochrome c biogenesis protein CcmG, thiol:disulfide interchange protein DsbE